MFCLYFCAEILSIEISLTSVVLFVISSSTSNQSSLTSPVDVQLQLFVCRPDFSVFSKAVFGRGGAPSCVG